LVIISVLLGLDDRQAVTDGLPARRPVGDTAGSFGHLKNLGGGQGVQRPRRRLGKSPGFFSDPVE
jgi:hypothetical protein